VSSAADLKKALRVMNCLKEVGSESLYSMVKEFKIDRSRL
jgi:hypothetical protein